MVPNLELVRENVLKRHQISCGAFMKSLLSIVTLLFVSASTLFADEVQFPKTGDAMFKLTIPANWAIDSGEDDIIEAQSPKENVTLSIWEIDSEMTVAKLAKDLKNILKEYATDVKLDDDPKQIDIDGMGGIFLSGTGKDDEDGHEVGFVGLVVVKGDDAAIIFFEMDGYVTADELKKFKKIIESIKAAD